MKRTLEHDTQPPIKRHKNTDIMKFVPKIHDALGGQALDDVHTQYGTSFCLFFIPSPPLSITSEHIKRLVNVHNTIEFVIFKGTDPDTLTIQVDLTPLIDNEPVGKLMDQVIDNKNTTDPMDKSIDQLDDKQKRIIRWMQSFGTFEFDYTYTEKTISLKARSYQSQLHGFVLAELDKIKENDFYKNYRILLSGGKLTIRFQTT